MGVCRDMYVTKRRITLRLFTGEDKALTSHKPIWPSDRAASFSRKSIGVRFGVKRSI